MKLQEIFINNLRFYRKQKNLTQNQLTLQIDKGYNYINGVEQGKYFPQPDVIEQICTVLNINPYQLFKEDGCPENLESFDADKYIEKISNDIYTRIKSDIKREIEEAFKNSH